MEAAFCVCFCSADNRRLFRARGLSVAPGPAFSASGGFRDYLRINVGHRWSAGMEKALDGFAKLVEEVEGGSLLSSRR